MTTRCIIADGEKKRRAENPIVLTAGRKRGREKKKNDEREKNEFIRVPEKITRLPVQAVKIQRQKNKNAHSS